MLLKTCPDLVRVFYTFDGVWRVRIDEAKVFNSGDSVGEDLNLICFSPKILHSLYFHSSFFLLIPGMHRSLPIRLGNRHNIFLNVFIDIKIIPI